MSIKSTLSSPKNQKISQALRAGFGSSFQEHADLRELSYLKIGGIADFVVTANNVNDLTEAAKLAFSFRLPYRVIGATTGTLFSDVGFPGLLIVNRCQEIILQPSSRILVQSGFTNDQFLNWAAARSLGGLEFLAAIPGTIGGLIATEGSYGGKSIRSFVKNIALYWPAAHHKADEIVTLPCDDSVWQLLKDGLEADTKYPPIVVNATFQASQIHQDTLLKRLQAVRQQRSHLPERKVGYIFNRTLDVQDLEIIKKIKVADLTIDRHDPNLLTYHQKLKTAADLRDRLEQWRTQMVAATGYDLDNRLSYLGYWPEKEGNEKEYR